MFLLFSLLFTSLTLADTRSSMISLSGTQGPDDFKSGTMSSNIGVNEDWAIKFSFFQSDSGVAQVLDEELISTEIRIGGDVQINETWGSEFGVIARRDPYEVQGRGAYLGGRVVLSDFWASEKETSLSIRLERMKYTQDLTVQGTFKTYEFESDVTQESVQVTLDQEIISWWMIFLSHRSYKYSDESSSLAVTSARRRTSWGGSQSSYGLPDQDNSLGFQFFPYEWFEISLETSRSKLVDQNEKIKTNALTTTFTWDSFSLDLSASKTDFGDTSGDDEEEQTFYTAGIAYTW